MTNKDNNKYYFLKNAELGDPNERKWMIFTIVFLLVFIAGIVGSIFWLFL